METHKEIIKCPNCGHIREATAEMTKPFATYIHTCVKCGYVITESEWEKVSNQKYESRSIIDINNTKKIEIQTNKNGIVVEICNEIDGESTVCSTTLSKKEVILFIQQLKQLIHIDKNEFCECNSGFKLKNFDKCAICGGKWKGRKIK